MKKNVTRFEKEAKEFEEGDGRAVEKKTRWGRKIRKRKETTATNATNIHIFYWIRIKSLR